MTGAKQRVLQDLFPASGPKERKKKRKKLLEEQLAMCDICLVKMSSKEKEEWVEENKNGGKWHVTNFGSKANLNNADFWEMICLKCVNVLPEKDSSSKSFNSHTVLKIKTAIGFKRKPPKKIKDSHVRNFILDAINAKVDSIMGNDIIHRVEPTMILEMKNEEWDNIMKRVILDDLGETMEKIYEFKREFDVMLKKFSHDSGGPIAEKHLQEIPEKIIRDMIEDFRIREYSGHHFLVQKVVETPETEKYRFLQLKSGTPELIDIDETERSRVGE
jgi:hypothetical protein